VAVAAARSAAAAYSATAAAQWQQCRGCGRFIGTGRDCADAHAYNRHRRADVRIFVIGRGRRDNSADGIVVVGSAPVKTSTAVANVDVSNDDTANAYADANGDGNDIVC
jgi:hypothetical protein